MKARAISAAMLMMMGMSSAFANVRIYDDRGGQIGEYLAKYQALRVSGEKVEIDGTCASACTMLLGVVPRRPNLCYAAGDPCVSRCLGPHTRGSRRLVMRALGYCGRDILQMCASGSVGTADCTRK